MKEEDLLARIEINPKVMVGKPVIKGTRIPVEKIVKMISDGMSKEEILRDYPHLKEIDIRSSLFYASRALSREEILPLIRQ